MTTINLLGNAADFEGFLLKQLNQPHIYLVLDGKRRHVPNPDTLQSLFGGSGAEDVLDIDSIPEGDALTPGAVLARADNAPPLYLVSNGMKRHITSPGAVNKYHFHGNTIVLPLAVVDSIPTGDPINA
ncbi:MAG: hypothetical protein NTX45_22035 [Proteobacteria bacterium]|nr:hypothetical protein [Pseudomonadota bacterium]